MRESLKGDDSSFRRIIVDLEGLKGERFSLEVMIGLEEGEGEK